MADGVRMQQRRATEAVWTTSEYVLAAGELGVTTDTEIIKIGDGVNSWTELPIAFESQYLPLLGTAANSELLEGISADFFVKVADTDVAASNNTYAKRSGTGTVRGTTASASTDLVPKAQMDTALLDNKKVIVGRTVTSAATLALGDLNAMIFVNHSSLTTQVVITIPTNATVAFPTGSWIDVCATGAGGVKISPAGGVSLSGKSNIFPNFGVIRLMKLDTNLWLGVPLQQGGRLPKIRAVRTGGTAYGTGAPTCIPWNTIDSTTDFYNPDNEWFTVPGSNINTARRIVAVKDGEYLATCNFITTVTTAGALIIAKLINDNTMTGATYLCNVPTFGTGQATVRVRLAAGESIGAAWQPPGGGGSDQADGTFSNRNEFIVTRLSD